MGDPDSRGRAPADARRALLGGLIDHEPLSVDLSEAVAEDHAARAGPHAWLLGRLVCRASRLGELREAGGRQEASPALSVVLDGAEVAAEHDWLDALRHDARLAATAATGGAPVEAVELLLPYERPASSLLLNALRVVREESSAIPYLELRAGRGWRDTLPAAIGATSALGGRVKLRCGPEAEGVSSVEQVALVIVACREAGARLKVSDQPGALAFVSLLAAMVFAHAHRLKASEVEPLLAEKSASAFTLSGDRLVGGGYEADAAQMAAARAALLAGYAGPSWREPVEALGALGVA